MANKDLRDWIEGVKAAGELKTIKGAETKEEIGGFVDIYMRKMGNPAVMFDEIPGYPKGHRVLANILTSVPRINIALGLPPETTEIELTQWWRNYFKNAPSHPTKAVNGGPLLDNVLSGADVNIEKIPTPVWHELDGGPFIGTACLVVMKDPDSGWVNYGTYRVQSHEPKTASVMMSPGKHGLIIMRKYHERGQKCPVAVVAGMHPSMVMLGGIEIPYGKNELEAAGGILGESVEVINMPKTGLPVPANCEIAFEGFIGPDDKIKEGPLGEWTGYYASGSDLEPAIRIETLMYRNDPILVGAIPAVPPNDNTFYFGAYRAGAIWNQLEAAGIPEVKGVWTHQAGGSRFMMVDLDQDALRRAFQAGGDGGGALPRRRLQQPLDHRGRRRHRSDQLRRRGLGDVHALRSARPGRHHRRRLVFGARPDVLRHRRRPAEFAGDHRRLHPVPAQEDVPEGRALQQGAGRPHAGEMGEGFAEGVLSAASRFGAASRRPCRSGACAARRHLLARRDDRFDDIGVAGAAADLSAQFVADGLRIRAARAAAGCRAP